MTKTTQRDFKSEFLFCTCFLLTNLVTSLEYNPLRFATMLCHPRQTRSSYLAIPVLLRGITVTMSATGNYVAVPERFEQNEEPASRNEDPTKRKHIFVPESGFNQCINILDF